MSNARPDVHVGDTMPSDAKGAPLKVGDRVTVECVVVRLGVAATDANCLLRVASPMDSGHQSEFNLNTHQIVKINP